MMLSAAAALWDLMTNKAAGLLPSRPSLAVKSKLLSQLLLPPQAEGAFFVSVSWVVPYRVPVMLPVTGGIDNATCFQVTIQMKVDSTVVWTVEPGQAALLRSSVASLLDEP